MPTVALCVTHKEPNLFWNVMFKCVMYKPWTQNTSSIQYKYIYIYIYVQWWNRFPINYLKLNCWIALIASASCNRKLQKNRNRKTFYFYLSAYLDQYFFLLLFLYISILLLSKVSGYFCLSDGNVLYILLCCSFTTNKQILIVSSQKIAVNFQAGIKPTGSSVFSYLSTPNMLSKTE